MYFIKANGYLNTDIVYLITVQEFENDCFGLHCLLSLKTNVRSTARHAIHLQFDISTNTLVIRAVQSPKCIVRCAADCTPLTCSIIEF
jgi:hypothetical protein